MPRSKLTMEPLEKRMDLFGDIFAGASILAAIILFLWWQQQDLGAPGMGAVYSLLIVAYGVYTWLLFRAGGEILRLLKKLVNVPFVGEISGSALPSTEDTEVFVCPNCETEVGEDAKVCPKCGTTLD